MDLFGKKSPKCEDCETMRSSKLSRSGFKPKWGIDWMLSEHNLIQGEMGYVLDMFVDEPFGSVPTGRIATFPSGPKPLFRDEDFHLYLISEGLISIARSLIMNIDPAKIEEWRGKFDD